MLQRKRNTLFIIIFFLIAIPFLVFLLSKYQRMNQTIITPAIEAVKQQLPNKSQLEGITKGSLLKNDGQWAIVIKNLETGESYSYNENKKFDSASLYKLWVMAVAFEKIGSGTLSEEEVLSLPIDYLDNQLSEVSSTPTPENQTPTPTPEEIKMISMKTSDAIEKMISVSDNYAALLVASRSGTRNIVDFIKINDFKNSNFRQPPQTSAQDIALFFEKLYEGELVSSEISVKMIEILKKQELNDRIPKYLPDNIEVAHKTGELFGSKHDAGIVYGSKGDYVLVIMSETKDQKAAAEQIAKFSKEIFDYFEKN